MKVKTTVVSRRSPPRSSPRSIRRCIIVNRGAFTLTLYKHLKLAKTYGIAVGQVGLETPAGLYNIQNKAGEPGLARAELRLGGRPRRPGDPAGRPPNPIKARWMGIYDGAGIHGTVEDGSIGSAASPRLHPHAHPGREELYDQVDVGDPVYIA